MKHDDFIEALFSVANNVKVKVHDNITSIRIELVKAVITSEVLETIQDKCKYNSWKQIAKEITSSPNTIIYSGILTYTPSKVEYVSRALAMRDRIMIKKGIFFDTKGKTGREMYGSSEVEDALRYKEFSEAHGYTTNPCAEIIMREPVLCPLTLREENKKMKIENIIRVTYSNKTIELKPEGTNDCAEVEALVEYAVNGMKAMQDRAAKYRDTAIEAGVNTPANIMQNFKDREAEFAEILDIVANLNLS